MDDSVAALVNRIDAKSSAFKISCSLLDKGTGVPDHPEMESGKERREKCSGTGLWSILPKRKKKDAAMINEETIMLNCLERFKLPPLLQKPYCLDLNEKC